jgi:hypothetical protein
MLGFRRGWWFTVTHPDDRSKSPNPRRAERERWRKHVQERMIRTMNARFQIKLKARDGERTLVLNAEIPAAPVVGLTLSGRGWSANVDHVALHVESGEYRASCKAIADPLKTLEDLMRPFTIERWREAAA